MLRAVTLGGLLLCLIFLCHFFLILIVDTLVFLVAWNDFVFFEEVFHGFCLLSGGEVFDGLLHFRAVQRIRLDGEDAETGRVFELAPEVFHEILEHVGVPVDFQEGVAVFLVCRNGAVFPVLSDF